MSMLMNDASSTIEPRRSGSDLQRPHVQVVTGQPLLERLRATTPARILTGCAGAAYLTTTWLQLRLDHAAARDAVRVELDLIKDLGASFVAEWGVFEVSTQARTKEEYLRNPELGRRLCGASRIEITRTCPGRPTLQVAIGDGLSATAVKTQVPALLPLLSSEAERRGWRFGQPLFIRHSRVGVLNDIGEILQPTVAVLLIGERPGLATADSLSAYMAFRPRLGHDDADRNLISNIHARGVPPDQAAHRIIQLAAQMIELQTSGVAVKESAIRESQRLGARG
jgi:ethanolamine ammonia-lyase small subunit